MSTCAHYGLIKRGILLHYLYTGSALSTVHGVEAGMREEKVPRFEHLCDALGSRFIDECSPIWQLHVGMFAPPTQNNMLKLLA